MNNFNNQVSNSRINNNNVVIDIFGGIIQNIAPDRGSAFVTVSYGECLRCENNEQTVVLIVNRDTLITDEGGNVIPVTDLREGMIINASISSLMTRSMPPQSQAFTIRVIRRPSSDNITVGRIISKNNNTRSITTISDGNLSSIIQFNTSSDTVILDWFGRRINFTRLTIGMRVRIRHASFMTANIPPQTTAFEIQLLR